MMVTAKEIVERFGIPRATLYRLVEAERIPAQRVRKPWHQREHYLFCVDDVQQALDAQDRKPGRPRKHQ